MSLGSAQMEGCLYHYLSLQSVALTFYFLFDMLMKVTGLLIPFLVVEPPTHRVLQHQDPQMDLSHGATTSQTLLVGQEAVPLSDMLVLANSVSVMARGGSLSEPRRNGPTARGRRAGAVGTVRHGRLGPSPYLP